MLDLQSVLVNRPEPSDFAHLSFGNISLTGRADVEAVIIKHCAGLQDYKRILLLMVVSLPSIGVLLDLAAPEAVFQPPEIELHFAGGKLTLLYNFKEIAFLMSDGLILFGMLEGWILELGLECI